VAISFIGGGKRSTLRKPPTCLKSLTNYHIMLYTSLYFDCLIDWFLGTDHLTCREVMVFVSFSNFFSDNTRVRIFFFVAQIAIFFPQNLTLGYMTETLNQIIFFSSTKIRIFQQHWESEYFFREKPYPPLPPFKLNGRFLIANFSSTSAISWRPVHLYFDYNSKHTSSNQQIRISTVYCEFQLCIVIENMVLKKFIIIGIHTELKLLSKTNIFSANQAE
jgi:hypothetical protein